LSHVSDPGKPEGSHFIVTKNRDSMPTADRGKEEGKASLGKPKSGSTEWYVTEEVNPIDKTRLSEKQARFANTKKKLIIVAEEPEGIIAVDDEMYNELSAPTHKSDASRNRKCES